jgi:hypothetical protein
MLLRLCAAGLHVVSSALGREVSAASLVQHQRTDLPSALLPPPAQRLLRVEGLQEHAGQGHRDGSLRLYINIYMTHIMWNIFVYVL